ncbi:MAG: hypothetical protein LBK23_09785 [Oscillospiraceae bacterium]|jgi:hypothetical protein|nr:hypothetical protein [Oscillospiraceae bacterium]
MVTIWEEVLGHVRYPDQTGLVFDGTPYDEVVEWLSVEAQEETAYSREVCEIAAATLAELERRWAERQRRAPQAARKVAAS